MTNKQIKIKCPLHSNYIHNKCKTINLSVCNRGVPIRVFLWPMPVFRNQGSRWPICDADFFGRYVYLKWPFSFLSLYLIKESKVIVYCRAQYDNSSSSNLIHSNNAWLKT